MLSRCPFYDRCDSTDRLTFGNNEYNCLGSTSYEYCQKYKGFIIVHTKEIISDPIEELNRSVREIYGKLNSIVEEKIYFAILKKNGRIVYCDYSGLGNYVNFIVDFIRHEFESISVGNFMLKTHNADKFGFYRISSTTLVAVNLNSDKLDIFETIGYLFNDYASKIDSIIERLSQANEALREKEDGRVSVYSVITAIKDKLGEDLPALYVANELNNALQVITRRFAWNPLIYEIDLFISKLKTYNKDELIKSDDKEDLVNKLDEWANKVSRSS